MAGHKGVTITIALLLAVAMTVAVAAGAFFFFQKFQQQQQGQTESMQTSLLKKLATCIKLESYNFNPIDNSSEAVIRNCGFRELDLGNDTLNLMFKTPIGKNCAFTLNSQNCGNCVGKLGIGSFVALQINASAVSCSSTLADLLNEVVGQVVTVVLSDKGASFSSSVTFIPEGFVTCTIGMSSPADQMKAPPDPPPPTSTFCYDYSITNNGNAQDTFTVNLDFIESPSIIFNNFYNGAGCVPGNMLPVATPFTTTLPKGQTASFSYNVTITDSNWNYWWLTTIRANSANCASAFVKDKTCSCYNQPPGSCPPLHPKCL